MVCMKARAISATYTAGDVISLNVSVTADHGGRMNFAICPNSTSSEVLTEECFTNPSHALLRQGRQYSNAYSIAYSIFTVFLMSQSQILSTCVHNFIHALFLTGLTPSSLDSSTGISVPMATEAPSSGPTLSSPGPRHTS